MSSPWTENNAALFVVTCMRLLMRVCSTAERADVIKQAHLFASVVPTANQNAYDLVFAENLLSIMNLKGLVGPEEIDHAALWELAYSIPPNNTFVSPVATDQQPPKPTLPPPKGIDPNDRSKWTVEQWEAEGIKFKPSAATIEADGVSILQRPTEEARAKFGGRAMSRARPLEQLADELAETYPWGRGAVVVAKWCWEAAGLEGKPNITRQMEISRILTVLHHAGVLPFESLVPVGMGHKKEVRVPGAGRPKKSTK